jgi:hypothetical protein
MIRRTVLSSCIAVVAALLVSATAHAQLFRAYLAPTGVDTNPCTLPAPCRLLPAALAAVANGGEIWMLDSANYNATQVNINKSVTILAVPGAVGSVVSAGGNAITVVTASKVVLRNLVIVPLPGAGGVSGVAVPVAGSTLVIEDCVIANMPGSGVRVVSDSDVRITDSVIRGNDSGIFITAGNVGVTRSTISGNTTQGVFVYITAAGTTTVVDVAASNMDGNSQGFLAFIDNVAATVRASVHDSRINRNATNGLGSNGGIAGSNVTLSASNNVISNNDGAGIVVYGFGKVWASGIIVSGICTGFWKTAGIFESASNNAVRNSGAGGDPSGTITPVVMR